MRFWSVFDAEMYTARSSGAEPINFGKLDSIIDFLLEQRLTPFIELGEKPERIQASPMHAVLEPRNTTLFTRYPEFLQALDQMFAHLVQRYGISEVEKWVVELWDDHRVEVYQDKQTYARLFKDVRGIVKAHVPGIRLGGAGNHLGWHKSDTTDGIRRWIDEGIYPDFISYDYYPYAAIGEMSEKFSKRKTNPDDFRETLDELRRSLLEYGFPGRKLFITDWNSTVSQRNVLNDSCWKACWLLKNAIDTLGQADMIAYSQISDITGDYYDAPLLLSGMAGLLTKEGIRKPAYYAMRFLAKMLPQMVSRGEHYLITRDESGRYAIALHNFKPLNYLWYMKEENAIPLAEQYRYFDDLSGAQLDVVLRNMESGRYVLRKSTLNRKHGSVADEWAQMNCFEQLRREDIDYLRGICAPHVTLHSYRVKDGTLTIPVSMQPLEISLIEVLPEK